jgi:predicted nuclease of predicted toxin-antitoxin system
MKVLLDENIPIQLKRYLPQTHEWYTVRELGWQGTKNGRLLKQMVLERFDGLVTMDKNLYKQQNFLTLEIFVIVISSRDNKIETLRKVIDDILKLLTNGLVGYFEVKA